MYGNKTKLENFESHFAPQKGQAQKFEKVICTAIRPSSDVLAWPYCRAPVYSKKSTADESIKNLVGKFL